MMGDHVGWRLLRQHGDHSHGGMGTMWEPHGDDRDNVGIMWG